MEKKSFKIFVAILTVLMLFNTVCSLMFLSNYVPLAIKETALKRIETKYSSYDKDVTVNKPSLKMYSTTSYAEEEKVMTLTLTANVYPIQSEAVGVTYSIDSVTDCPFTIDNTSEYIKLEQDGLTCNVKIFKSFLGGTVTIKCESNSATDKVSDTCDIKYLGVPTSLDVTYNGANYTIDNACVVEENTEVEVLCDLDNYFSTIGNISELKTAGVIPQNYFNNASVISGSATYKITLCIGGKTEVYEKTISFNNEQSASFDFSEELKSSSFTDEQLSWVESLSYVKSSDYINRLNARFSDNNDLIVSMTLQANYSKDRVVDLYEEAYDDFLEAGALESIPFSNGDFAKYEYDFSEVLVGVGTFAGFNGDSASYYFTYFKVQAIPTDITLSDNEIII